MHHRNRQRDMSHTLPADIFLGNFHTAAVADNPFVPYSAIFTAMAFPIFDRTKDFFAEKPVFFRLIGAIVDGLGFGDFAS